jgi:hypothetical protein
VVVSELSDVGIRVVVAPVALLVGVVRVIELVESESDLLLAAVDDLLLSLVDSECDFVSADTELASDALIDELADHDADEDAEDHIDDDVACEPTCDEATCDEATCDETALDP